MIAAPTNKDANTTLRLCVQALLLWCTHLAFHAAIRLASSSISHLMQPVKQGITEQHSAMPIGLKVDSNVKLDSLLMQVLDACGCDSYLDAQIVAHEGCGCPIGICCLHYAHLQTQVSSTCGPGTSPQSRNTFLLSSDVSEFRFPV